MLEPTQGGLMTLDEVSSHLRCSKAAVYRWVHAEDLPAVRVGNRLRFRSEDVESFLTLCKERAADRSLQRRGL